MKIVNIKFGPDSSFQTLENDIEKLFLNLSYEPVWQTIQWNQMLEKAWYIEKGFFIWIYDDFGKLENFMIIEKRSIWFNCFAFFIIGWSVNDKHLEILENEIIKLAKIENIVYIQIEPLIDLKFNKFKKINLKKFIEPYTVILDLKKSEDQLLAEMKPKWRYNIKVAEKNSILIEKVTNTQENLKIFYNLLCETNQRDSFNINSENYFKNFLDFIYRNNIWWLYFAKKDDEIVSAWIFIILKNTCYYYYWASTSDNSKRKFMASYLIQWKLIQEAKNKWCLFFDFLWIACPEAKKSHLSWVTDFKLKFSDKITKWPDSQIYVNKKIVFYLFLIKYKLKNFFKN